MKFSFDFFHFFFLFFFFFFSFAVEIFNKNKFTKDSSIGLVTVPKLSLELDNASKEAWFPIFLPTKGFFFFSFCFSSFYPREKIQVNNIIPCQTKTGDDSPNTPTSSDAKKAHSFGDKYFAVPRNCDHCTRLVWKSQAFACGECGFVCHAKCQDLCKPTCGTVSSTTFLFLLLGIRETEERCECECTLVVFLLVCVSSACCREEPFVSGIAIPTSSCCHCQLIPSCLRSSWLTTWSWSRFMAKSRTSGKSRRRRWCGLWST